MAKRYVLKDAAQVNVVNGLSTLMLAGSVLPENIDPVQLQHLLDFGIAVEGEFVGGLEPVYTGDLQTQVTSPVADGDAADDDAADSGAADGGRPPQAANKDVWVDYAVAQAVAAGQDEAEARAEAEGLTKADLIDRFKD